VDYVIVNYVNVNYVKVNYVNVNVNYVFIIVRRFLQFKHTLALYSTQIITTVKSFIIKALGPML
jgi:hypothetical protein